jgi:hypothetical protein
VPALNEEKVIDPVAKLRDAHDLACPDHIALRFTQNN